MKPRSTRSRAAIELTEEASLFATDSGSAAAIAPSWLMRRQSRLRVKHIGTGRRRVILGTSLSLVPLEFVGCSPTGSIPSRIVVEVILPTEWTSNMYLNALYRSHDALGRPVISIYQALFNGTWYNTVNDLHFLFDMSCFEVERLLIDSYALGRASGGRRIL